MKQLLIIPDVNNLEDSLSMAERYSLGFEFNDFTVPEVLDNEQTLESICGRYGQVQMPSYCSVHGAFYDVIPFSEDKRIREISNLRIEQSIAIAKRMGSKAVVFHTNYNPFLNSSEYINHWISENISCWSRVFARHKDIEIYLENMFDTSPDIMVRLSEGLQDYENYGVCLDYAHAALSQVDPGIWAQRLGHFVKHVHINDNDLVSDLHLAWGDGKMNRAAFYENYDKYLQGTTVLIETNSSDNIIRSLEVLSKEGFI